MKAAQYKVCFLVVVFCWMGSVMANDTSAPQGTFHLDADYPGGNIVVTDADGDTLSVASVTDGTNGSVAINGDGTVTYTPAADFHGTDSFSYTASDGRGGTDVATVNVIVAPVTDISIVATDAAKAEGDVGILAQIASTLVTFEMGFEILPGTARPDLPEELLPGVPQNYATVMPFRGIGEGIASLLAEAGANVVCAARSADWASQRPFESSLPLRVSKYTDSPSDAM